MSTELTFASSYLLLFFLFPHSAGEAASCATWPRCPADPPSLTRAQRKFVTQISSPCYQSTRAPGARERLRIWSERFIFAPYSGALTLTLITILVLRKQNVALLGDGAGARRGKYLSGFARQRCGSVREKWGVQGVKACARRSALPNRSSPVRHARRRAKDALLTVVKGPLR